MSSTVDTSRCPLCGNENHCAMAPGADPEAPCWCSVERFPQELLDRVPEEMRNMACICAACLREHVAGNGA